MFKVGLFGKIIYLCNRLLLEKLLLEIIEKYFCWSISKTFILARCINDFEYSSCTKEFSVKSIEKK